MKKKYRLLHIARLFNIVEMVLHEVSDVQPSNTSPPLPLKIPDAAKVIVPMPQNEEEEIVYKMSEAMKKFLPGVMELMKMRSLARSESEHTAPATTRSMVQMHLKLSLAEYKTLGAPGVDEVVEITLHYPKNELKKKG